MLRVPRKPNASTRATTANQNVGDCRTRGMGTRSRGTVCTKDAPSTRRRRRSRSEGARSTDLRDPLFQVVVIGHALDAAVANREERTAWQHVLLAAGRRQPCVAGEV